MALGLSSAQITARVRAGTWTISYRGVYHLAGVPLTDLATLRTAVLVGGPSAAVSHRSAAGLWGLEPIEAEGNVRAGVASGKRPAKQVACWALSATPPPSNWPQPRSRSAPWNSAWGA